MLPSCHVGCSSQSHGLLDDIIDSLECPHDSFFLSTVVQDLIVHADHTDADQFN